MVIFSRCIDCKHLFDETVMKLIENLNVQLTLMEYLKKSFFDSSGHMCNTLNAHKTHFKPLDNNFE